MITRRVAWMALAGAALAACAEQPGKAPPQKSIGNPNAKVKIEVFSDYQCPACKTLYEGTLEQVKANYAKAGKIYLVSRFYPLPMHAYARRAAWLACAAERIGKYEQVSTALYRQQEQWSRDGNLDRVLLSVMSPSDVEKVRKLAAEPGIAAEVDRDVAAGGEVRVQQTPTMIIYSRGQKYPVAGAVTYEVMQRALDSLLAK